MANVQSTQFKVKKGECLSCGYPVRDKYCSHCSQSTHTERLDFHHFIMHDIVHGVFHMDRGFLKTLQRIMKNPARVSWDYILGNRRQYYNFFYLLLILIGVHLFLSSVLADPNSLPPTISFDSTPGKVDFYSFINSHSKLIIFFYVPLFA